MIKTSGFVAFMLLGLTSFALPACSGKSDSGTPSAADQCKALYTTECNKVYECYSAAELAQTDGMFGTSKADCPAAVEATTSCDKLTACDAGQTYNSAKATECTNAFAALTCADFTDPNADAPAACNEVCTGDSGSNGTAGTGSGGSPGAAGGSSSGTMDGITECKKLQSVECQKIFMCFTADELAAAADTVGKTEADCETMLDASDPCMADQCDGGTFDGTQAEKCLDAYTALTCDEFTGLGSTTAEPTECGTVCSN